MHRMISQRIRTKWCQWDCPTTGSLRGGYAPSGAPRVRGVANWFPMRASELAERPWVPNSGWPLELDVLAPYYRRVEKILQVEGPPYDQQSWRRLGMNDPGFDPHEIEVRFSQWAALGRRNFALLWRRQMQRAQNVTVLLDATAVNIRCNREGVTVRVSTSARGTGSMPESAPARR